MLGMLILLFSDSTTVDIRALVSQDIDKARFHGATSIQHNFLERFLGMPELVLILELALLLIMAGLFVSMVLRYRRMAKGQKDNLLAEQRMKIKRPSTISRGEIERILNQIASERVKLAGVEGGNYYVDYNGRLDSDAAVHEMARNHKLETERLNFAISYASQAAKRSGTKFKEAFALVSEDSDLNVLARQLNMGKGELELILALKKSKIANSKDSSDNNGRRPR